MRRYFWLIPLIFLGLATLACSPPPIYDSLYMPPYEPVRVAIVQADAQIPGKAYIIVAGYLYDNEHSFAGREYKQVTYETTDYGETWQPSNHTVFFKNTPSAYAEKDGKLVPAYSGRAKYYWSGGNLYADALEFSPNVLWKFPRSTFRYFFQPEYPSTYFNLDYHPDYDISAADPTTIYISLGTEGVLVGPNPENPGATPRAWKFSHKGIDAIQPLPLTITDPQSILSIIALGLFIPLLSGLHLWLLAQVYRYAFQPGERFAPYKLAGIVTGIITLLAAFAIYIWLTDANTDYYPIVGIMTLICVVISTGTGIWISRKYGFSNLFVRRMASASALVSVLIPAGIAAIWGLWPFLISGVVAFGLYRRAVERRVEAQGLTATRWELDRMGRRLVVITAMSVTPIAGLFVLILIISEIPAMAFLIPVLALLSSLPVGTVLYNSMRRRSFQFLGKKKNDGPLAEPLFEGRAWRRTLLKYTAAWSLLGVGSAFLIMMLQSQAQHWFQTLLINRP